MFYCSYVDGKLVEKGMMPFISITKASRSISMSPMTTLRFRFIITLKTAMVRLTGK